MHQSHLSKHAWYLPRPKSSKCLVFKSSARPEIIMMLHLVFQSPRVSAPARNHHNVLWNWLASEMTARCHDSEFLINHVLTRHVCLELKKSISLRRKGLWLLFQGGFATLFSLSINVLLKSRSVQHIRNVCFGLLFRICDGPCIIFLNRRACLYCVHRWLVCLLWSNIFDLQRVFRGFILVLITLAGWYGPYSRLLQRGN